MAVPSQSIAISVIVPCRNAAAVVDHQLEALCRQNCERAWEVIVVDNGSSDGSRQVVERFQGRLPWLTVIETKDRHSAAYARNAGAHAARGENVAFCDADDEVGESWLEAVDRALRDHLAVAFRTDTEKLNGRDVARRSRQIDGLQQYTYPPYLPYSGATIAVRRNLFLNLGGFDESMIACEDADLCWRLQHAGVELYFAHDAVVHVRLRPTLRSMCRQARLWGEYNVVLYKKFRPLGMPQLPRVQGLRNLVGTIRRFPRLANRRTRASWLWEMNWAAGRLIGSLKHGVWGL